MAAIWSVAATAFRESIRNRTLLATGLVALGVILSALLLAELSLDQRVRVIKDWGLMCVSFFGVLLAILMGVSLVHKEVSRKSLYAVLSRPIHRWQYIAGKFFGMAMTLLVQVGLFALALVLLLAFEKIPPEGVLFQALLLSLLEILLVAALAVFFASFSSPYLSGFFTLGVFVVGRSLPVLLTLVGKITIPAIHWPLKGLVLCLPNLSDFAIGSRVIYSQPLPTLEVLSLSAYACGFITLLLVFSAWIFSRRDLV
jgi:ABC-type transport system involved in multi-copper enzyme maturation permease subunit